MTSMQHGNTMRWHKRLLVTGVAAGVSAFAALVQAGNPEIGTFDSRTVPYPDWVQVSGQIEQLSVVSAKVGGQHRRATIRPTEGGQIAVDLGPADGNDSFQPKQNDFIHIRGKAIEREGKRTIIAKEVFAEGKIFSIRGNDEEAAAVEDDATSPGQSVPPSPAAPAPQR
jgi:hypothetical protein